jgi:hypothetical protein
MECLTDEQWRNGKVQSYIFYRWPREADASLLTLANALAPGQQHVCRQLSPTACMGMPICSTTSAAPEPPPRPALPWAPLPPPCPRHTWRKASPQPLAAGAAFSTSLAAASVACAAAALLACSDRTPTGRLVCFQRARHASCATAHQSCRLPHLHSPQTVNVTATPSNGAPHKSGASPSPNDPQYIVYPPNSPSHHLHTPTAGPPSRLRCTP